MGLGGAGHAAPLLTDAIYLNPSYNSLLQAKALGLNYLWFGGDSADPNTQSDFHGHNLNFSYQDGQAELFQAGVALTTTDSLKMFHLGASKAVTRRLGFGLGSKFVFPNDGRSIGRDGIFSVAAVPLPWVQASFVVDNVFQSNSGEALDLYREFLLGLKVNVMSILLIYFDPHLTPDLPQGPAYGHEVGVEFAVMSDFFLRVGNYRNAHIPFEQAHGDGFSAGAGWLAGATSFDFGFTHALVPIPASAFSLGMTVYF